VDHHSSIASFVGSPSDRCLFGLLFPSPFVGVYFIARRWLMQWKLLEKTQWNTNTPVLGKFAPKSRPICETAFIASDGRITSSPMGAAILSKPGSEISRYFMTPYAYPTIVELLLSLAIYPFQLSQAFTAIGKTHTVSMVSIVQAVPWFLSCFRIWVSGDWRGRDSP